MPLACSALAPLSNELSCETGSFSCHGNPCSILQLPLSLQFPGEPALHHLQSAALPCCRPMHLSFLPLVSAAPTSLGECFFNSLVVGLPCSLIFWQFWLFFVFKLVVILLLVVHGSKVFLPTTPSWPELPEFGIVIYLFIYLKILFIYLERGKGGRKRGREISMCGCLSRGPHWGPGPEPRHML